MLSVSKKEGHSVISLYNLSDRRLLILDSGEIKNLRDDTLAYVEEGTLVNQDKQRLAHVENHAIYFNDRLPVATIVDGFVVNGFAQKLAWIDGGDAEEQALLGAAFMLFYAGSS